MRRGLSIAGAALLAATILTPTANAQQSGSNQPGPASGGQQGAGATGSGQQGGGTPGGAPQAGGQVTSGQASGGPMQATGSCGVSAGDYGMSDVNASKANMSGETVPALFYRVDYAGLPAPTTVGVIIRYNGELESQTGLASFTAQNAGGSFEGALRANISPEAQGFANSIDAGRRGRNDGPPSGGSAEHGNRQPYTQAKGGQQGSGTQGGLVPGEYVFYVYTGEIRDIPETVKDGPAGPRFFADPKGYLGTFSCGVSTEQGSGPG